MDIARLIYNSRSLEHCDTREINKILECSERLNASCGVTGILYFSNNNFLQYLEGDEADVARTYERITQDNRHTDIQLVDKSTIQNRQFSDWAMAYVPESDKIAPILEKHMDGKAFNPQAMSTPSTLELIFELRTLLPKAHYDTQNQ